MSLVCRPCKKTNQQKSGVASVRAFRRESKQDHGRTACEAIGDLEEGQVRAAAWLYEVTGTHGRSETDVARKGPGKGVLELGTRFIRLR